MCLISYPTYWCNSNVTIRVFAFSFKVHIFIHIHGDLALLHKTTPFVQAPNVRALGPCRLRGPRQSGQSLISPAAAAWKSFVESFHICRLEAEM